MPNLMSIVFQVLAGANNINTVNSTTYPYINPAITTAASATATSSTQPTATFVQVISNLDNNLNKTTANSMDYAGYSSPYNYNTGMQSLLTPNLSTIMQEIKDNPNQYMDSLISDYLINNFGGSKAAVIANLSGVKNLPAQAATMQDQLFNLIVSKLSIESRQNMYVNNSSSSLYYSDSDSSVDNVNEDLTG